MSIERRKSKYRASHCSHHIVPALTVICQTLWLLLHSLTQILYCQYFGCWFRIGWKQQPVVPVPTWFATINVARQPQIACLPLICLYIHSLLSFVYIDQNAIIECRVCVLIRDQSESNMYNRLRCRYQITTMKVVGSALIFCQRKNVFPCQG